MMNSGGQARAEARVSVEPSVGRRAAGARGGDRQGGGRVGAQKRCVAGIPAVSSRVHVAAGAAFMGSAEGRGKKEWRQQGAHVRSLRLPEERGNGKTRCTGD